MGASWVDFAFSQLTRCCYCIGEKIKRGKGQREEKTEGKREGKEVFPVQTPSRGCLGRGGGGTERSSVRATHRPPGDGDGDVPGSLEATPIVEGEFHIP